MVVMGLAITVDTGPGATETSLAASSTGTGSSTAGREMTTLDALILGAVEGITEYLPISSTGHLVVTQRLLGIGETDATRDAADSYAIAIQFGAILAVLVLYRQRLLSILRGLIGRDAQGRALLISLVLAFVPAAVIGLAFEAPIKDNLLGIGPVVVAWIVGGVVLLVIAPRLRRESSRARLDLVALTPGRALVIGAAQVVAMWPGTSRSLVTILAALAVGTTLAAAVEFSFLLGLVTLGAATLYETTANGSTVVEAYGWFDPLVGLIAAFVFAVIAVRWMVSWLQTRSLAVFGWERLAAAGITIGLLTTGVI